MFPNVSLNANKGGYRPIIWADFSQLGQNYKVMLKLRLDSTDKIAWNVSQNSIKNFTKAFYWTTLIPATPTLNEAESGCL